MTTAQREQIIRSTVQQTTETMIWDMFRDNPDSVGVLSLRILRDYVNRFTPDVMARVDRERLIRDIDGRIKTLNS